MNFVSFSWCWDSRFWQTCCYPVKSLKQKVALFYSLRTKILQSSNAGLLLESQMIMLKISIANNFISLDHWKK